MRKSFLIICISLLLVLMPVTMGLSTPQFRQKNISLDDPPSWAHGNFTGRWGFDFLGIDLIEIGDIGGFYGKGFVGSFKFSRFYLKIIPNNTEMHGNGSVLQGLIFGPYLIGQTTDIDTGNVSSFAGIGGYNETLFNFRLVAVSGPTLFAKGTFSKFE